jgi:hypothetical protein
VASPQIAAGRFFGGDNFGSNPVNAGELIVRTLSFEKPKVEPTNSSQRNGMSATVCLFEGESRQWVGDRRAPVSENDPCT